jgi:hypothetical protein
VRTRPSQILAAGCVLIALLTLAGCAIGGNEGDGTTTTTTQDPALLLGRWMDTEHGTGYEFLAARMMTSIISHTETSGSYRVTGNKISMFVDDVSLEATWKVHGAILTLTLEGLPSVSFKRE